MERYQFEYFLAVVDQGGINAAATALNLAQPTISQAIRLTERELGVQLFHRIGRGMVLSSAGHALIGPARRVMRGLILAGSALSDDVGRARGRLDLAVASTMSAGTLADIVAAVRNEAPGVVFRISELRDEASAPALIREGHCEIAICHLPIATGTGLVEVEFGRQEWWLTFPPGTGIPGEGSLALTDLPDVPFVVVPKGTPRAREIENEVRRAGRELRISLVLEHREARLSYVLAGLGAAFLDRPLAEEAQRRGATVRSIEPQVSTAVGLVYDSASLSPAGRVFVSTVQSRSFS
ncbi:LysR family transcriptional regulator [Rhodococcus erythropolis]|uniref:LysR family transcriptional regulator n=1 Tax=Rhodococcus erythropolis TaxID=1833 RepID=UPI00210DDD16|nr:LysR family transcriptional regulator [Rhodococcus erythropolis]MCQ4129058.1 LysR family transcriptional regulator [Rhodococcus erythropolis]